MFPADTKYFGPANHQFMINYIVDDMDAFLDRMQQQGVKIDPKRQDESYGRFAWIYDSERQQDRTVATAARKEAMIPRFHSRMTPV